MKLFLGASLLPIISSKALQDFVERRDKFPGKCPEVYGKPFWNENESFYRKLWYIVTESPALLNFGKSTCNRIQYRPAPFAFAPMVWTWHDGLTGEEDSFWLELWQTYEDTPPLPGSTRVIRPLTSGNMQLPDDTFYFLDTDNENFAYVWSCFNDPDADFHYPAMWIYNSHKYLEDIDEKDNEWVKAMDYLRFFNYEHVEEFSKIYHHIENGKHCDDLEDQYYKNQVEKKEFSDF